MNETRAVIHTVGGDEYLLPSQPKSHDDVEKYLNYKQSKSNYLKCVQLTDRWPNYFLIPFDKISHVEFIQ